MKFVETFLPNEEAQLAWGKRLGKSLVPPLTIFLHGPLGAGKTTLVRGFLQGLGYHDKVKSPSYNLVESYELGSISVFHFDFYRIQHEHELDFIGFEEYWTPRSIFLIEWPDKALHLLPPVDLSCTIEFSDEGRKLRIEARSEQGEKMLCCIGD